MIGQADILDRDQAGFAMICALCVVRAPAGPAR